MNKSNGCDELINTLTMAASPYKVILSHQSEHVENKNQLPFDVLKNTKIQKWLCCSDNS